MVRKSMAVATLTVALAFGPAAAAQASDPTNDPATTHSTSVQQDDSNEGNRGLHGLWGLLGLAGLLGLLRRKQPENRYEGMPRS
ncbi:WGxxGxxG family protein [Allorhizocola rhizosphaerae]|uniref:WGxxGxxG family protein n=1 Tax=Allorhizocola rhizosphaerae TaxID=1872709 RepID=UPI003CCC6367